MNTIPRALWWWKGNHVPIADVRDWHISPSWLLQWRSFCFCIMALGMGAYPTGQRRIPCWIICNTTVVFGEGCFMSRSAMFWRPLWPDEEIPSTYRQSPCDAFGRHVHKTVRRSVEVSKNGHHRSNRLDDPWIIRSILAMVSATSSKMTSTIVNSMTSSSVSNGDSGDNVSDSTSTAHQQHINPYLYQMLLMLAGRM